MYVCLGISQNVQIEYTKLYSHYVWTSQMSSDTVNIDYTLFGDVIMSPGQRPLSKQTVWLLCDVVWLYLCSISARVACYLFSAGVWATRLCPPTYPASQHEHYCPRHPARCLQDAAGAGWLRADVAHLHLPALLEWTQGQSKHHVCYMMSHDVVWCHMMLYDVTWCMMSHDVVWSHMMEHVGEVGF